MRQRRIQKIPFSIHKQKGFAKYVVLGVILHSHNFIGTYLKTLVYLHWAPSYNPTRTYENLVTVSETFNSTTFMQFKNGFFYVKILKRPLCLTQCLHQHVIHCHRKKYWEKIRSAYLINQLAVSYSKPIPGSNKFKKNRFIKF